MKLLINTESLLPPITGIGTYTQNLLEQFLAMQALETIECFSGHHFTSATQALQQCGASIERAAPLVSSRGHLVQFLRNSSLAYRARETLRNSLLRLKSARLRNFVYHEPNFILRTHKGPCVATIHDLSFIHYPHYHPPKRVAWLTRELPRTLARADMLITDSEQVRQELIARYAVDEQRVRAIYLGAADCYTELPASQTSATLAEYGLEHDRYLLFVGTLEPRKGVDTLIEAWSRLPEPMRQEYPLVLAGAQGWNNHDLQARIDSLAMTHGLRHLQFVPIEALPSLYAGASIFVYPSLYEGFGLPVLEAMNCGTPVICTTETTMAEFSAGATMLCEPGNSEQLKDLMQKLLEDDARRATLGKAGLERAKVFSWQRCASETLAVYRVVSGASA